MKNTKYPDHLPLRRLSLAIALACVAQGAGAEDTVLEPITVESKGIETGAFGVRVDESTLKSLRAATNDTASLLRDVPGVTLNNAGAVSSLPSIHGLADDRLRIKLDGMDLISSCPNHMNPPLSYVSPSNVDAIQVFAGISPVSVSGDSIGGTIIAETPPPEFAAPGQGNLVKGELGAYYRSNNNAVGANAAVTFANEKFSASYMGDWSKADNYTAADDFKTTTATGVVGHTLPLDEVGSSAYESQNDILNLALRGDSDLVEAQFGYQNMPEQLYPNQRMDLLDNEQKRFNLGWTHDFSWGELDAQAYYETVDHYMNFGPDKRYWYGMRTMMPEPGTPCSPIDETCADGMPMYTESDTSGVSVASEYNATEKDLVRLGFEYQHYHLDDYWPPSGASMWPDTFYNINDGTRNRAALYAEWESQLNPAWLTSLGMRYENVTTDAGEVQGYDSTPPAKGNQIADAAAFNESDRKQTDNNVDITALARYDHSETFDIEVGAARKVRSPNLYERYAWSTWPMAAGMNNFVGDGNGYVGDIDLKPEKAYTLSATFDWHAANRSWDFVATPYYTRVFDYIDAIPTAIWLPDQFNVLQYANQSARLYGLDLSGQTLLGENDWGQWGLGAVVNYTNGKNVDTDDNLYNIMPLNGRFTLTHEIGGWDNNLEWLLVSRKDQVNEVRNEIETPGYGLVNLRFSHSWRQVRVDFGVENLFDQFYYLPTGGAYTGQGSTMMLNGIPWGIGVPGMGRSLYAGVNLTF
ncbi:MAG: TonB-dependent receptor [Chromatiales bacterium]|jgi:iron complex outermembrane receptor protein